MPHPDIRIAYTDEGLDPRTAPAGRPTATESLPDIGQYEAPPAADPFDPAELAAELAAEELLYAVGLRRRIGNAPLAPHGTPAAFKRHLRHGEKPCPPCREANNAARRVQHPQGISLAPHGTTSAYKRHLRHGEKPCPPCREANTRDKRPRRACADRPHKPIAHGTAAGYKAHRYRDEAPCPACYEAHLADNRTRHAARRRTA
jgi:hypothetical protein